MTDETTTARLIGGPYDGITAHLRTASAPARITVGTTSYVRIDDPDTNEYLGGYAHQESSS